MTYLRAGKNGFSFGRAPENRRTGEGHGRHGKKQKRKTEGNENHAVNSNTTPPLLMLAFLLLVLSPLTGCGEKKETPPSPAPKAEKPEALARIPGVYEPERCRKCGAPADKHHQCNRTQWCPSCLRDCGVNHVCGKTDYCSSCLREIGRENHVCGKTRICRSPHCTKEHYIEVGPNHVCKETRYCKKCGLEHYPEKDDCPETYACPRCEVEASRLNHVCGLSSFCRKCSMEAAISIPCPNHSEKARKNCPDCRVPHTCNLTRFCPLCRKEKETTHRH